MGKHRRRHSSRDYLDDITLGEFRYESDQRYTWIVYAIAALAVGGLMGYVLAIQGTRSTGSVSAAPSATTSSTAPVVDESALRAYREILARDPKNIQAAASAANMLYDAQRYVEAIPLYQQAFTLNPSDINISTDLGTALWYSGRADEALAQYDKSLAINATHAQTLFNIGIVKSEGKRDYAGAVAAWEKLLATNPAVLRAALMRFGCCDHHDTGHHADFKDPGFSVLMMLEKADLPALGADASTTVADLEGPRISRLPDFRQHRFAVAAKHTSHSH